MSPLRADHEMRDTAERSGNGTQRFPVVLPHTDLTLTEVALREAARLARGLEVSITLLAVQIVPFPDLLDPTRGCPGFPQLLALAESAEAPVTINIVYARDWETACQQALPHGSTVVMAARKGWLRSREEKLAHWLTRTGHKVTLVQA